MTELLPEVKAGRPKPLSFRIYDRWIDTKTFKRKFGIQAKTADWKLWRHVAENHEALIFDSRDEAEAKMALLEAEPSPPVPGM
jgi:hypothetical protein